MADRFSKLKGMSKGAEEGDDYKKNIQNSLADLSRQFGGTPQDSFSNALGSSDQQELPPAQYGGNMTPPPITPEQKARMDQIYANLHQMPSQPAKSAADYKAESQEAPSDIDAISKPFPPMGQPSSDSAQLSPEQKEMKKQALMRLIQQKSSGASDGND